MLLQIVTIVKRPLCPTFVHDDLSRIIISIAGISISCILYYYIIRKYNKWGVGYIIKCILI